MPPAPCSLLGRMEPGVGSWSARARLGVVKAVEVGGQNV